MVAAASVAAGVGASYYVLGNPLTLIQDQNVVEAGAFYVGTGVVYYVSMQIGNQVVAATQKM